MVNASKSDPPVPDPLSADEHSTLREPYTDLSTSKEALIEITGPLLDDLEEEGYLESGGPDVFGVDRVAETPMNVEDRRNDSIHVTSMWNRKNERGIVLLHTTVTSGNHVIRFTVNPTEGVASANVPGEDGYDYLKKASTDDDDVSTLACNWDCSIENGTYCCWGAGRRGTGISRATTS